MRIAICDDEKEIREMLSHKIQKICNTAEIFSYSSGEKLIPDAEKTDILFLDIQMSGKNGMETAKEIRRQNKEMLLIFVTVMEEYVFQAFDVGAFHYLVKPFDDDKLREVLLNAKAQYESRTAVLEKTEDKHIIIKTGGTYIKILLDDIVYAEIFNRKIIIHKKDEDIEYYGRMSKLAQQAGADFFRPHRAYLVHFKYVDRYDVSSVKMENGATALMAKQNYPEFVKSFLRYNQRKGNS